MENFIPCQHQSLRQWPSEKAERRAMQEEGDRSNPSPRVLKARLLAQQRSQSPYEVKGLKYGRRPREPFVGSRFHPVVAPPTCKPLRGVDLGYVKVIVPYHTIMT